MANYENLEKILIDENITIKDAMRTIDLGLIGTAFVVDENQKLLGIIRDGDIRSGVLSGMDIKWPITGIINREPIYLKEADFSNTFRVRQIVRDLLAKSPNSRYIPVCNENGKLTRLVLCSGLLGERAQGHSEPRTNVRRVLVVGGAGYLGSMVTKRLLDNGYQVRVLDMMLFGDESVLEFKTHPNFELIIGDMRNISTLADALVKVDAVINLAAIVGDPACITRPDIAIETNYLANKALAEACKYHQINRYIYASTCSVYGVADSILDELSPLNPVSLYARSKIQSEEGILSLMDENFSPVILRMSTLYGLSPRMRFDLVVNTMTMNAYKYQKITIHGGGTQWRPLLHVSDAAEAYLKCLEAPIHEIRGEVFNVGSSEQNYQILTIANTVHAEIPEASIDMAGDLQDARNYNVSFAKIQNKLGFTAQYTLQQAVHDIADYLKANDIDVKNTKYYNVESMKELEE